MDMLLLHRPLHPSRRQQPAQPIPIPLNQLTASRSNLAAKPSLAMMAHHNASLLGWDFNTHIFASEAFLSILNRHK